MKPPPPAPASVAPCTRWRTLASMRLTASGSASHIIFFCAQYRSRHAPTSAISPASSAASIAPAFATSSATLARMAGLAENQRRSTSCSRLRARRVFPVYTSARWALSRSTDLGGRGRTTESTLSGSRGGEVQRLMPGSSPPAWSCQPPPVVSICSTCSTAWVSDWVEYTLPIALPTQLTSTPASIEDVPNPEPVGSRDHDMSSIPPPAASSWAAREAPSGGWRETRPQKSSTVFGRAPGASGEL
mmetsp:Transcript_48924/g.153682  ORF Transcript_48924/g.153682 Transcript_48924/m.153682 type:complete len:245 (-) Transcript_48924:319-1053(-)